MTSFNLKFVYIGKEKDTESNLGDHGVRKYDSDLGRFLCPDAMWEKYISYTPYQYAGNDPINKVDWNIDYEKYYKLYFRICHF